MANKKVMGFKVAILILCLSLLLITSFYLYNNIHNGINLQEQKTKVFYFNYTTYDIYKLELFNGKFVNKYNNGKIKRNFEVRNGKLNGTITEYYKNGIVKFTGNYNNNKITDGCALFYYENGNLESKFCWRNGKQHGIQEMFYENGNKKLQSVLQEGKLLGLELVFRENGTLLYEIDNDNATIREFDEKGNFIGIPNNTKVKEILKEILWNQ